jgi:hypothetical protein
MNKGALSVDEALERMLAGARPVAETESVPTLSAAGRVLATGQRSTMNVPPMDNSAMDGAPCAPDQRGLPPAVAQKILAGAVGTQLAPGTAARIFTGAPIPAGADAVVMQEDCAAEGDRIVVKKIPQPGEWIRRVGSDIRAGDTILPAGIRLRPQDTGLAASVGIASLPVRRRVRLGLFFTGDELVMPGDALPPGRIYNSNRFTLNGLAHAYDCEVHDYGIVPDSLAATRDPAVPRPRRDVIDQRVRGRRRLRLARGGGRASPHVAHSRSPDGRRAFDAFAPARYESGRRAGASSFVARQIRCRLRDLPDIRALFRAEDAGIAGVNPHSSGARRFRPAAPDARREFPRVKWKSGEARTVPLTQDTRGATSTAWLIWPGRQSGELGDPRERAGDTCLTRAVSVRVSARISRACGSTPGQAGEGSEPPCAGRSRPAQPSWPAAAWRTALAQTRALRVAANWEMPS